MPWDPEQYEKFKEERFAPFADLVAVIRSRQGMEVLDLGCGTGELTRDLALLLPESRVTGIDNSPAMLERAAPLAGPRLSFRLQKVEEASGTWDLVFSNAVLHWVDDHETLIPRLISLLRPGGQFVAQIPNNTTFPSHTCIIATAGEEPFRTALGGWTRKSPLLPLDAYATLLHRCGTEGMTVWEKVYPHLVADADAIADWTRGTTLIPYLERLPTELHDPFMARYREKLRQTWPTGPVLFTFRRIILSASRPG